VVLETSRLKQQTNNPYAMLPLLSCKFLPSRQAHFVYINQTFSTLTTGTQASTETSTIHYDASRHILENSSTCCCEKLKSHFLTCFVIPYRFGVTQNLLTAYRLPLVCKIINLSVGPYISYDKPRCQTGLPSCHLFQVGRLEKR